MRKALLLFCLFWLAFPGEALAQEVEADPGAGTNFYRNSVYGEVLGSGLFGSLNYERIFQVTESDWLALRIGGLYIPERNYDGKNHYMFTVPAELTLFFGERMIKPEIGIGCTLYQDNEGVNHTKIYRKFHPMLRLGVRFYYPETPLLIRFGIVPLDTGEAWNMRFFPWPGISVGYSFGKKKN